MNVNTAATDEVLGTENLQETAEVEAQVEDTLLEDKKQDDSLGEDAQDSQEKKVSTFAKRMQRLEEKVSAQVEAAKLEAEFWKQQALGRAPKEEGPKTRTDFNTDDEWIEHRLAAERDKLLKEAQEAVALTAHKDRVVNTYLERVNAAKQEYSDWDEVFSNAAANDAMLPGDAVQFCLDSAVGAKIAYHLAKNEAEYDKFIKLPPVKQIAFLGVLEDRFVTVNKTADTKKVTAAPNKLANIKSGGSVKQAPSAATRFESKEAWKQWYSDPSRRKS
jgi:predicted outer membrane protein